jgi:hypothetical protein
LDLDIPDCVDSLPVHLTEQVLNSRGHPPNWIELGVMPEAIPGGREVAARGCVTSEEIPRMKICPQRLTVVPLQKGEKLWQYRARDTNRLGQGGVAYPQNLPILREIQKGLGLDLQFSPNRCKAL